MYSLQQVKVQCIVVKNSNKKYISHGFNLSWIEFENPNHMIVHVSDRPSPRRPIAIRARDRIIDIVTLINLCQWQY